MLPYISGEFRLVDDPELIFTPSGVAVAKGRCVANSRKKEGDEWVDDKVCWLRFVTFKRMAENVAESLVKGALVTITGKLQTEEWEKEGEKRQAYTILVDTIGPSLAFKPAKIVEVERASTPASAPTGGTDPWGVPSDSDVPPF